MQWVPDAKIIQFESNTGGHKELGVLVFPYLTKHTLGEVAKHFKVDTKKLKVPKTSPEPKKTKYGKDNLHDAMVDVLATREVFLKGIQCDKFIQKQKWLEEIFTTDTHITRVVASLRLIDKQL